MSSLEVILLCCTSSFIIAAYLYVRFIPQDSCALHNKLFILPSKVRPYLKIIVFLLLGQNWMFFKGLFDGFVSGEYACCFDLRALHNELFIFNVLSSAFS